MIRAVAQEMLDLFGQLTGDFQGDGQGVVLLRAQPAQHEADVHPAPPRIRRPVCPGRVNDFSRVEQDRPGRHDGLGHFFGLRLALGVRPAMAARSDKRGAVFFGEVVQREYRADREFRAGPGEVGPVAFVAVQHLGRLPPPMIMVCEVFSQYEPQLGNRY